MSLLSLVKKAANEPRKEEATDVQSCRDWPEPGQSLEVIDTDDDGMRWYLIKRKLRNGGTADAWTREDALQLIAAWRDLP